MPTSALRRRDERAYDAVWLAQHLLGRRAFTGLDQRLRRRLAEQLAAGGLGGERPIDRVRGLDRDRFHRDYVDRSTPVVLAGAATDWPAVATWTPRWIADRYGADPVVLIAASTTDLGTDAPKQGGRRSTLGEVIARMEAGHADYARFVPLLHAHPELEADLDRAWLSRMAARIKGGQAWQLFLGGAGTDTAVHAAMGGNLFVQVHGRKRWWIVSPRYNLVFDPPRIGSPYFHSRLDVTRADHPLWRHVDVWTCELSPGDVLYNPPFFWHQVHNPTVSIGVGYRWYAPAPILRSSRVMAALTLMASNPPLWVVRQHRRDFAKIFGELTDWSDT